MLELQGIAVSPGVAIGQVLILDQEGYRITRCQVAPVDLKSESERLLQAIEAASVRLDNDRENSSRMLGQHVGQIFSAHQQILLDPSLQNELLHLIKDEAYSAEYAVSTVFTRYAQAFRRMGSSIMAERALDIRDVERVLLEALGGHPTDNRFDTCDTGVLACHDLTRRNRAIGSRSRPRLLHRDRRPRWSHGDRGSRTGNTSRRGAGFVPLSLAWWQYHHRRWLPRTRNRQSR